MTFSSRPACSSISPASGRWKSYAAHRPEETVMALKPFSSRERGLFASVDGPTGAGTSIPGVTAARPQFGSMRRPAWSDRGLEG
jgi:hypothetical protein